MKKFSFKRQIKNMCLNDLKNLRNKHFDYMCNAMLFDDNEASKQNRYIGYIDQAIKKLNMEA